jgi:hypothetical protein
MHSFAALFTSFSELSKHVGEKLFSWAKQAHVDFSSSNFNVEGHILNTGGDALRTHIYRELWALHYAK